MNSKLRDALTPYLPLYPEDDDRAEAEKAIRQAVGEELMELLPTDENVTTKYGYHRDEKKYGYRMAIVDIKEVIKQWQGSEDA